MIYLLGTENKHPHGPTTKVRFCDGSAVDTLSPSSKRLMQAHTAHTVECPSSNAVETECCVVKKQFLDRPARLLLQHTSTWTPNSTILSYSNIS